MELIKGKYYVHVDITYESLFLELRAMFTSYYIYISVRPDNIAFGHPLKQILYYIYDDIYIFHMFND